MPDVYWLIGAQRRFLEAMDTTLAPAQVGHIYETICRKLAATFPEAAVVLVRGRLRGYGRKADRHILLVEVIGRYRIIEPPAAGSSETGPCLPPDRGFRIGWPGFVELELGQPTRTTAHVVKIADDSRALARELAAWESCRPEGMTHDSILMRLRPGPERFDPVTGPVSIVYEDAHHVIGTGEVVSLEEAVCDACLWATPSTESIEILLKCLFERLGSDFYGRSREIKEPEKNLEAIRKWKPGFDQWVKAWDDSLAMDPQPQLDRLRVRREVLGHLSTRRHCFIDPVDYLKSVIACPQFCPLLLWGCSHGDLHGRNVLVSILDDDVSLPALFDYEEMGLCNAIGWDFVKLETELKVRVLPQIYTGAETEFLTEVGKLECYLAESTLAIHDQKGEPPPFEGPASAKRLARILMTIRKQGQRHLGLLRERGRQWLEAYYFLLACYGVCAARYDAYQGVRRQIAAAYISAGVAARQLSRPWTQLEATIRHATAEARELLNGLAQFREGESAEGGCEPGSAAARTEPRPPRIMKPHSGSGESATGFASVETPPAEPSRDPHTHQLEKVPGEMSHHARLAFAREWARSRERPYIEAAARILKGLRQEFPHVLEIEEELALAHLELEQARDAEILMDEVQIRYSQLSEEMLCRFGRHWKDTGGMSRLKDRSGAARLFQIALDWYQKAHAIRSDYYPGINVATLQFVLGQRDAARKAAQSVERALESRPPQRDELVWIWATQAEAQLLLASFPPEHATGEACAEAERLYRQAVADCPPAAVQTMRRQAELIVAYAIPEVQSYWTATRFDEVFGPRIP